MNTDYFVENVKSYCKDKGVSISKACRDSGAGETLMDNVKRGRIPSIDRIQLLAQYLGVTTSELLGEEIKLTPMEGGERDEDENVLVGMFRDLNQEGREKLLDYADDLVSSGKYKKNNPPRMGKEEFA